MSYSKIMIHLVWGVKNRQPLLTANIRPLLLEHIRSNAEKNDIFLDFINCHFDHFHGLISLKQDQTIQQAVKLIKGESSHWINQQKLLSCNFLCSRSFSQDR